MVNYGILHLYYFIVLFHLGQQNSHAYRYRTSASRPQILPYHFGPLTGVFLPSTRQPSYQWHLSAVDIEVDTSEDVTSIEDEIRRVIEVFKSAEGNLVKVDPSILTENAHLLAKGKYYEMVMEDYLRSSVTNHEITKLEAIDAFIGGFVQAERKQRSRLKLNYIIAGATSNRLEESIQLLAESDEIDDCLLSFIDSLIKKEILRSAGPIAAMDDDIMEKLVGPGKETIEILRMVRRRLEAELKMVNREEVKLLSLLLAESDLEAREYILRKSFSRVEDMERFAMFLSNGIEHLLSTEGQRENEEEEGVEEEEGEGKENRINNDDGSDGNNGNSNMYSDSLFTGVKGKQSSTSVTASRPGTSTKKTGTAGRPGKGLLPQGTLAKMRDLMVSTDKVASMLRTGLRGDDDIYSTNALDYLNADLAKEAATASSSASPSILSSSESSFNEDDLYEEDR